MKQRLYTIFLSLLLLFLSTKQAGAFQKNLQDTTSIGTVFFDSLKTGLKLDLHFHASIGCITLHDVDFVIMHKKDGVYADVNYRFEAGNGEKWIKHLKQLKLTKAQIDTLKQIELDMISIQRKIMAEDSVLVPLDCRQTIDVKFKIGKKVKEYSFIACELGSHTRFTEPFFGKL